MKRNRNEQKRIEKSKQKSEKIVQIEIGKRKLEEKGEKTFLRPRCEIAVKKWI